MSRYVALCGGVGGAKLAHGLSRIVAPDALTVIVNTGDDFEHLGLTICPDIDTVLYTLAGVADPDRGWGRADERWTMMDELRGLGGPAWFALGDKDLAVHLWRRHLLDEGKTLTAVTRRIAAALGVKADIVPMSDEPVRTIVETEEGALDFQTYFVARRCEPKVAGFSFAGAEKACLSPAAKAALDAPDLKAIIFCPSNPFVSIEPILAVPGVRDRLRARRVPVLAVAPIIGGAAIKGPTVKMMRELMLDPNLDTIAERYDGLIGTLLIDSCDASRIPQLRMRNIDVHARPILMAGLEDRVRVARDILAILAGG